ncbi:MAG: ribonuclease H family protein [Fusobacteriaceae bacterium]
MAAFIHLKNQLCKNTIRSQPNFTQQFILTTDASQTGIGAILSQKNQDGKERVISYFSRNLNLCEKRYSVTD